MEDKDQIQADREIIESLGGPAKVAELLEFDKAKGGVQRVQNWMSRGIPAKVKLARPDLFLPRFKVRKPTVVNPVPPNADDAERVREARGPLGRALPKDPK